MCDLEAIGDPSILRVIHNSLATHPQIRTSSDVGLQSSESAPSPSTPSSLTYVHRYIGYRNPNWHSLAKSERLTYLSVYDNRDSASDPTLSPSPPPSFTHVHRCIGYRNPNWHSLCKSTRLVFLSVYDSSVAFPRFT